MDGEVNPIGTVFLRANVAAAAQLSAFRPRTSVDERMEFVSCSFVWVTLICVSIWVTAPN